MKEIWKDIKEYEGKYQVSNLGKVKSLFREKRTKCNGVQLVNERVLAPNLNGLYSTVTLSKDGIVTTRTIHSLVLKNFIENPLNKPCCNHKDGKKRNNIVSNLEWCTYSENLKHAFRHNLRSHKGSKCPNSKLYEEDVFKIKKSLKDGVKCIDLAREFNVHKGTISAIKNGLSWRFINIK